MKNKNFKLNFTGERAVDNHPESDMYKMSMARYAFAGKFISKDDTVLDLACGSGYGSDYLSSFAGKVVGADIDNDSIKYCKNKYATTKNLTFYKIHPEKIREKFINKFNVIVSMETIEHVDNVDKYLGNLKRYLKKSGKLIITTPNNFLRQYPPANHFHKYEYDILELELLLQKYFPGLTIKIFGQSKTNKKHSDTNTQRPILKKIVSLTLNRLYILDKKMFNLATRLEHTPIYKKIGSVQRDFNLDQQIYSINPDKDFINPVDSIFVIYK